MAEKRLDKSKRKLRNAQERQRQKKNPKCPSCGKLSYNSESEAILAISTGKAGYRVYQCSSGNWHTTSAKRYM